MKKLGKKKKSFGRTFSVFNFSKKNNKSQDNQQENKKNQVNQEKKLEPICYEIHKYLKHNAVGYENRKTAKEIMDKFGIEKDDILRVYIRKIRDSDTFHKPICSRAGNNGNGYWIATEVDEIIKSANALEKRGWNCIMRAKKMKAKAWLNNQTRITFSKHERNKIESVIK